MSDYQPQHFINRELSWLAFNERVLQEAEDSTTPPLNQLAFLAIVSSNLDEFVMIRLAGLRRLLGTGKSGDGPEALTARQQIDLVARAMRAMVRRQYRCFAGKVWPRLARQGLRLLGPQELTDAQRRHVAAMFDEQIYPLLTPLAIDEGRRFNRLPDLTINVLVRLRDRANPTRRPGANRESRKDSKSGDAKIRNQNSELTRAAVVPIPAVLPRIIAVPSEEVSNRDESRPGAPAEHAFVLLEDVVLMFLGRLFEGQEVAETALFRVTRDADLSVEESGDEDFLAAMADVLVQRRESAVIRLELAESASAWAEDFIKELVHVSEGETFRIRGPLDLRAFWSLVNLPGLGNLRYPEWRPQPCPSFPPEADFWEVIRRGDVLLHHPYESFEVVIRLLQEAAADRNVLAVKQVLYRTSGSSKVIAALEQAALAGKQVAVLVELKARFDEARNIEWARRLERAGAQVIYGLAGLKVHAKALMIVRRDPDRIRRYVHLATGNYNESTAGLYTDFGLLTCDEDLGADVAAFFNAITGFSQPAGWRKIAVAPRGLRQRLLHLIHRETERAAAGRNALIMAKLNALVDREMIEALYEASRAGVRVRLNVRGVCCLRPGVKGVSENIEVVSIVGRFLEHGRVLYFRNGGEEEVYLTSADWMPRNLDRRVELLFPVQSPPLKKRLVEALEAFLGDAVKGRRLSSTGRYLRSAADQVSKDAPNVTSRDWRPGPDLSGLSSQDRFMQSAEAAARKMAERTVKEFQVIKPQDRAE